MCGIAGFCNPKIDYLKEKAYWQEILDNMNKVQKHRGPNGQGKYISNGCGLAHVRLSIIDLKTGDQPIIKKFCDKNYTIIYNGEIYNMMELKNDLMSKGIKFNTKSDTEVILMGHLVYGCDFVKKLNGIFSYAIWDDNKKILYLYRDRLGIKPLFYTVFDGTLIFSSEIKGILQYPGFKAKLDKDGLCEVFGLGPAKTYGKGVFKDIFEVLPGHFLKMSSDGLKQSVYWKLKSKSHKDSFEETVDKTSYLIYDSIKRQMISDIPICTFLSGGVDSSIVTSICATELQKQGKKLNTFSFDFVGNNINFKSNDFQPSQDRPWVEKMATFSKTNHIYLECQNDELIKNLYSAVDAKDLPCMADVESSLLYFCSKVVKYNKVTLTGECADEIFGGYPWFHKQEMFKSHTFPWSMDLSPRKALLSDETINSLPIDDYVKNAYQRTIAETPLLDGENATEKRRRELSYLNIRWFMATLLDRMDRTSMYSGLEARVPFADHRIIEYIWNVPWEMKCPNGLVKGLLRKAAEKYLPHEILYRKKSPYPKTYNPNYAKLLGNMLCEIVSDKNSPICNFIDETKVHRFIKNPSDYGSPWYGQLMAGPQMLAYMIQINYWLKKYNITLV